MNSKPVFGLTAFNDRRTAAQKDADQALEDQRAEVAWQRRVAQNVRERVLNNSAYLQELRKC